MGIEVDGVTRKVTSDDGEISVKAGSIHQFFLHPESPGDMTVYLSASDAGMDFQLDRVFFENWYGYWHDALLHEGGLSLLQYLAVCQMVWRLDFLYLLSCRGACLLIISCNPRCSPTADQSVDPRRRRRIHARAVVGTVPAYCRLLELRHTWALDRRYARV